jgi:hypothetical protein
MATVKKLNTIYTIDTTDVYLTGNLHVSGVYDTTTVTNTNVQDKDITLNVGEAGWGVGGNSAPGTSSVIVDRGLQANVSIRWNETIGGVWQLTVDGSNYGNIFTNPLSSNLITNGYHVQFDNTTIIPSTESNKTKIYAAAPGSAGSGLYVVNDSSAQQELVTKAKAIVFSLIL